MFQELASIQFNSFKMQVFISRFYTETDISTRRCVFSNFSSVSIKSADQVKIIVDVEFHFLFSLLKLKTKTDVLLAIRLEHTIR